MNKIDTNDLIIIQKLKHNSDISSLECKIYDLKKENSDLQYQNILMKIYFKYNLDPAKNSINQSTGEIIEGEENDISKKDENDERIV